MSMKDVERVLYFENHIVMEPGLTDLKFKQILSDEEYNKALDENSADSFSAGIGAEAIRKIFESLDLKEEILDDLKIYKATAIGRTTGIARFFFKVEDIYETYFDQSLVKPLKSTRNIYEGGYTKNVEILYDYNNNLAKVNDIKNSKLSTVDIEKNVQDLISTFYFLRNHFDVKSLEINDFIQITIFFDAENYPFKMKFLGYENIKTKFGEINCLKFSYIIEF